jgi:hypothetical protein
MYVYAYLCVDACVSVCVHTHTHTGTSSGMENMASSGYTLSMTKGAPLAVSAGADFRRARCKSGMAGGHVPTAMVAPARASCRATAQPYPLSSATPATKATFPERSSSERRTASPRGADACRRLKQAGPHARRAPSSPTPDHIMRELESVDNSDRFVRLFAELELGVWGSGYDHDVPQPRADVCACARDPGPAAALGAEEAARGACRARPDYPGRGAPGPVRKAIKGRGAGAGAEHGAGARARAAGRGLLESKRRQQRTRCAALQCAAGT